MPGWALGVDLGTSFSAGAFATSERVEVLEIGRERRVPSTVVLDDNGRLIAGTLAQRMTGRAPERAERNPKRYIGRAPMLLGGTPVEARDAMAALLELFVNEGRARFDGALPSVVVLTHPVAWRKEQREVLRTAASAVLAATPVTLVEEPVAAAVHYAATHSLAREGKVAVYDLGGGTFDSAVLAAGNGRFDVVGAPGGDDEIGGEMFDDRVYEHFGAQLAERAPDWWGQVTTSPERRWLAAAADLLVEARAAKETLSEYETASQYVSGADADVEITRGELEDLIGTEIVRTVDILDETISRSGTPTDELVGIFLTGGASRVPLVQQTLRARHGDLVRTWDDPKIVVALGAARLAFTQAQTAAPPATPDTATGTPAPPAPPAALPTTPATVPTTPATLPTTPAAAVPTTLPAAATVTSPAAAAVLAAAQVTPSVAAPVSSPVSPAAPPQPDPDGFEIRLEGVLDARGTASGVYAYGIGPGGAGQLLHRADAASGAADRSLPLHALVDWAPAESGLLVADRAGGMVLLHTLTPELIVRSTRQVSAAGDPQLVAVGHRGWAFFPPKVPQQVTNANGLPWGEVGALSVMTFDLTSTFVQNAAQVALGQASRWFVNENTSLRRLLDQESPTTSHVALTGAGEGCVAILGQFTSRAPLGGLFGSGALAGNLLGPGRHQNVTPWQAVCIVGPNGEVQPLEQRRANWLYQLLCHGGRWLQSTTTGLEIGDPQRAEVLMARSRTGALRWVPAGDQVYAIGMDQTVPSRGVWIAVLDGGSLRTLSHEPRMTLLGHLTSVFRHERPRIVADQDTLWMGVAGEDGRSRILHVTPGGVRRTHCATGWLEPVARTPGGLLCLSAPHTAPGPGRWEPARLGQLPL